MAIKAILLGILAALFFSLTFLLNEINLSDSGYWIWVATLRYLWMLPMIMLLGRVPQLKSDFRQVWTGMKEAPSYWLIWSNVCFVLFYVPLTWSAQFLPGWLVSSLWQLTIVFGVLTTPLMTVTDNLGHKHRLKIPSNKIKWMVVILLGMASQRSKPTASARLPRCFGLPLLPSLLRRYVIHWAIAKSATGTQPSTAWKKFLGC